VVEPPLPDVVAVLSGAEDSSLFPPQAVISAPAAVAPTPISAIRRKASRRDIRPSTWSVAISSAM
jgi:hypothetical protein